MKIKKNILTKKNIITMLPLIFSLLGAFFSLINAKENSILYRILKSIPKGFISIPLFCLSIYVGNKINNKSFIVNLGISISKLFLIIFFIGVIFTFFITLFQ